ncbi:MAG: phosphatidylglycerophosphatase A [Gammaproteobacteria bacterium]|nr:phosphatidylglycerophosphatase A [Gammaproteobacteria bacterium]
MTAASLRSVIATPANFLALGGGVGLAPKAPGTFGTLLGIPAVLLMPSNLWVYAGIVLALFAVGVWCCQSCADHLGVHDHPSIVWDEIVGYLITMIAVPRSWLWILIGFVVFRLFDVIKPWPISRVDRDVHGGLGIMLDDVIAALFGCATMQILLLLVGPNL